MAGDYLLVTGFFYLKMFDYASDTAVNGRELPVITASVPMTANRKHLRQLSDEHVLAYKQFMALAG